MKYLRIRCPFLNGLFLLSWLVLLPFFASAQQDAASSGLDALRAKVERFGKGVPQEKVYLHLDNTCYFVGDTIRYKGYVTRSDRGTLTDLSRILYVELLTPDGYLVERQQLEMPDGTAGGAFVLTDSLYSGYYELRAYTRWMLNFGRYEHPHSSWVGGMFYKKRMEQEFFRDYDKLYSRVFPVYDKPMEAGDYVKDMTLRPQQRYFRNDKEEGQLDVRFYPEGGALVAGATQRVAFEANTKAGRHIDARLSILDRNGREVASAVTEHRGRGSFTLADIAAGSGYKAVLTYEGKQHAFDLPKPETGGCVMTVSRMDGLLHVSVRSVGVDASVAMGLQVMHGGVTQAFCEVNRNADGLFETDIPLADLPAGVNQLTLFDGQGRVYADRLVFVRGEAATASSVTVEGLSSDSYDPYAPVTFRLKLADAATPAKVSLSVRDRASEEASYDNGTMWTEMLLASELKGFVENPGYYFEADDETHRRALDLLMWVQGWRRYEWREMAGVEPFALSFMPEDVQTLAGQVNKVYSLFGYGDPSNDCAEVDYSGAESVTMYTNARPLQVRPSVHRFYSLQDLYGNQIGNGNMKHEVNVLASYVQGAETLDLIQATENGGFYMQTPKLYEDYAVWLSAKKEEITEDVLKKLRSKGFRDETEYPDYYVKLDWCYPLFPKPYGYYRKVKPSGAEHASDGLFRDADADRTLSTVTVENKGNGRRAVMRSKPVYVMDAVDAFNMAADWGLNCGMHDWRTFTRQMTTALFADMGMDRIYEVQERYDWKPLVPKTIHNFEDVSPVETDGAALYEGDFDLMTERGDLSLVRKRSYHYLYNLDKIYFYTDYAPREEGSWKYEQDNQPTVIVDYRLIPDGARRYATYRDRRLELKGYSVCEDFYSPDYTEKPLPGTKDYRRTLLWQPEVEFDANGEAEVRLFNNSKQSMLSLEVEGITAEGSPVVWKSR